MNENEIINMNYRLNFFTEIPDIIWEIGLEAVLISVYLAIKRSAGEEGFCYKSVNTLCKELCLSNWTLHKYLKKLEEVNDVLKKPLIIKENRVLNDGVLDTIWIKIVDIWPENHAHFARKK